MVKKNVKQIFEEYQIISCANCDSSDALEIVIRKMPKTQKSNMEVTLLCAEDRGGCGYAVNGIFRVIGRKKFDAVGKDGCKITLEE